MVPYHADVRAALHAAAAACFLNPIPLPLPWTGGGKGRWRRSVPCYPITYRSRPLFAASGLKGDTKPAICTADELHYVPVPGTDWRLALWRYTPCPEAPSRNRPLVLLSGVGTNAIGYDLSPGASFARHMSTNGFDTWIVEVRGAGLSTRGSASGMQGMESEATSDPKKPAIYNSNSVGNLNDILSIQQKTAMEAASEPDAKISVIDGNKMDPVTWDKSQLVTKLTSTFLRLAERLSGYLNDGQLKAISAKFFDQISKLLEDTRLSDRFDETTCNISGLIEARQNSAVAGQIRDLSQRLVNIFEEGQRSVSPQLFDLQERLSATIEDFQKQLDLIVTYDWDFDNYLEEDIPAAMDYIKLQSKTKDGKLLAIGHSMGGILLYAMLSKRGTIPAKVILQLTTSFREGGLRNRSGTFCYKDHMHKCSVPVLALAGDQDLICPPAAVYETAKLIPEHLVTYKLFGKPDGPHYAHYDLVGGRMAVEEVYPCIIDFLSRYDDTTCE